MQRALEFLREHNEIAFATSEGNLPRLRIFQIMKQEGTTKKRFAQRAQGCLKMKRHLRGARKAREK